MAKAPLALDTHTPAETPEKANKAYLLEEARATAVAEAKADHGEPRAKRSKRKRTALTIAGGAAVLLAGGSVLFVLMMPGCIKQKAIDAAAERGVALSIDSVSLGTSHVTLKGMSATVSDIPGMKITADEADVELSGITPEVVTIRSARVAMTGPLDLVKSGYAKWRGDRQSGEAAATRGRLPKIVFDQASVVWENAYAGGKLEAVGVHAEATEKAGDADVQLMAPRVTYALPNGTLGPWRFAYERGGATSRIRVAFDPEVPDTPNAIFVTDNDSLTQVDVDIPRAPIARLNVPLSLLGLSKDDPLQVEAKLHYAHPTASAKTIEATAHLAAHGIRFPNVQSPLEATLDGTVKGSVADTLVVSKGEVVIGRMRGALTGSLKMSDVGFRIELGWKPPAIECQAFLTPPAPAGGGEAGGDLVKNFQSLMRAMGKITGNIQLGGHLVVDTTDLHAAKFTPELKHNCDFSLFGR